MIYIRINSLHSAHDATQVSLSHTCTNRHTHTCDFTWCVSHFLISILLLLPRRPQNLHTPYTHTDTHARTGMHSTHAILPGTPPSSSSPSCSCCPAGLKTVTLEAIKDGSNLEISLRSDLLIVAEQPMNCRGTPVCVYMCISVCVWAFMRGLSCSR